MYRLWESKQVIPVAASSNVYHTYITKFNNQFACYSSDKVVVILSGGLQVIQIIDCSSEVMGLSWSDHDGMLAVAVGNAVVIYSPSYAKEKYEWKEKYTLEHLFPVLAVSWSPTETHQYIISGGSSIVIWCLNPPNVIPIKPAQQAVLPLSPHSNIKHISVSPDGRLIATYCEDDRTPKIYYKRKKVFGSIYLPHPRAIKHMSWRKQYNNVGDWRNVLLTTCEDGDVRFWVESDFDEKLQFTIMASINSTNDTNIDWISSYDRNGRPIYNLMSEDNLFHLHLKIEKDRNTTKYKIDDGTSVDWVLSVEPNGNLTVWQIENILRPKVKLEKYCVKKHIFGSIERKSLIAMAQKFSKMKGKMYPDLVSVYLSSIEGDIESWQVYLGEGKEMVDPKLKYRSFGHSKEISDMARHPKLPLAATLDIEGNIIIWHVSDTSLSDSPQILTDLCAIIFKGDESEDTKQTEHSHSSNSKSASKSGSKSESKSSSSKSSSKSDEDSDNDSDDTASESDGPELLNQYVRITWDNTDPILYALNPTKGIEPYWIPLQTEDVTLQTEIVHLAHKMMTTTPIEGSFSDNLSNSIAHIMVPPNFVFRPTEALPAKETSLPSDQSILLGLNHTGTAIHVWRMNKNPSDPLHRLTYEAGTKIEIPEGHAITAWSSATPLHNDEGLGVFPVRCSFVTGGKDGYVRIWRVTESKYDKNLELTQVLCFSTEVARDGPGVVLALSVSHFGRIATFLSGNKMENVCIWECYSSAPHYRLENVIDLAEVVKPVENIIKTPLLGSKSLNQSTSSIVMKDVPTIKGQKGNLALDWLLLTEGCELLSMARGHRIAVFSQRKLPNSLQSFKTEWFEIATNESPLPFDAQKVIWLKFGSLLVASSNLLYTFSKWITSLSTVTTQPSLFSDAYEQQSPHPFYHPRVLLELVEGGNFDRLGFMLKHLFVELSNFVDAEKKNKKKSQKNNAEKKKPFISTLPLRSVFKNVIEAIEKSETEKPPEVEEQPSEKKPKAEEKSDDSSEDSSKKIKKKKKKEDSDNYDAGFNDTFAFSKPQVVDDSDKYDFLGSAANDKEDSDISISMSDLDTDSDEEKKKKKKKKDKGKKKKKSLLDSSDEDEPSSAPPVEEIKLASSEKPLEDKYRNSTSLFENDNIISPDECNQLQEILTTYRLPDVSSNEQLYLVAILETLTKVLQEGKGLVDKCGVKFVLMTKIFNFFCKSAPPHLRPKRLGWLEMAWGLHADAHPTLVQQILPPDALWPVVSALGLPLWVRDHETIVSVADTLAKNHYTLNKNPNDCAIFYIALGRLAPLSKLFRVVKEDNIANFLDNDFTQKKFKDAALKNAYRLMGQHKFEMAAAFFVLGDSLSNALNVCIEKLDDFILGLFIARLVEKGQDGKFFKSALNDWVLPRALLREERELASIAYWLLKEYSKAVEVLVPKDFKTTEIGEQWICKNLDKKPVLSTKDKEEAEIFKPGSLHLFEFLCKSRMIQNRNLKFTHLENELYRRSFYAYDRNGCSVLAYEKKLLQDLSERSKTKQINEPKKFSIASYLQSKIHGSDSSEETTEVVEKPESALVSEIEKEMLFKSVISFLCKHIMEMQERALLLGARAVVAGTIHKDYNQDTFFNILTDDWALLSNYLSIPSDELLRSITAFCTSQGYIREHYFLLKYHKMNSQVGSFLVNEAHKITNTGLRYLCSESFLMSVSGKNSEAELTTAQSRRLEVLSRHLHGCLIDYLTPEQNFDEDEDDEKETLPPPEGSGLESKEGDKVLKSEEKKKEIMVPDLAMNDQLMVNIACRFGVFAAAWSQHDFLTLLELSYGKSMDILTKDQVSPMYVEDTSDQIQEESMPRSDSEVKKETMDYVKKLLLLLIRYQFIYMLENQYCTASIIHNLKVSQFALEKSLRNVPEQLYTEFRQVNKNMKNDFDETTFILNFVKKNHIFETGEDDKFGLMCQESALSLIEDSVIKKYLTQLSLMKNYHLSQPTHQTEEDQVELLVKLGAPSHHIYTDSITCQFSPPETIYHYKELIHCFDINPQNPNIIVFGTNSGTIEVDISAPSDIVTRELSANTLSVQKPTKEKSAKGTLRKSNSTKSVDKKTKEDGSLKTSTTNIPNLSSPRATNPAPTQVQFSPEHQATVHTAISTTPNPLSRSQSLFPRSGVNSGAPSSATPPSPSSRKPTAKELAATQTMRTMNSSTGGVPRVPNLVKYTAVYSVSFHPTKPYYISGSVDGHIQSYLHKSPSVVTTYKKLDCRVHKIKFNESGSKFGVCDHSGKVSLFRWTENKEASPYRVFQCHSGRCTDMIFLNLGSFFATVGHSHDKSSDNIQFWDSLLPEPKANVWSCPTNIEGGSSSLVFSPKQQILFVGFKKGAISAIDVKQRQTLFTIDAHVSNCRSLVVDPNCRYLVSGSTDGGIKVWDINKSIGEGTLMPLHTWPEVHKQQTFLRPLTPGVVSTYGVTEIRLINGSLFSCGSDGRIVFLPIV